MLTKTGQFSEGKNNYSTQPKDSLDKWNIKSQDKQYCDFSKVVQKVWKESKDKGGERRYKCKIFINDDGQFTQMYCSRNIHNFDLKLIMDCLISFDYSHFLDCMKSKEDGYTRDVWFTLGGSHYVPQRFFIASPEEEN